MPDKESALRITAAKRELLAMLGGSDDKLKAIANQLTAEGICDKTYAQVFKELFYSTDGAGLAYDTESKGWTKDGTPISDMGLISHYADMVRFVAGAVDMQWLVCKSYALSDAWLNPKEYEKTKASMVAMESFPRMRGPLKLAGVIMPLGQQTPVDIDWASIEPGEDDNFDVEVSFPSDE